MRKKTVTQIRYLIFTLGISLAATIITLSMHSIGFSDASIVVIYLLSVLLTCFFTRGYFFGILSSLFSGISFNLLFTPPYLSISISDPDYIPTFVVMLLAAVITSTLTSKLVRLHEQSEEKERQVQTLYQVTSALSQAATLQEIIVISADSIAVSLSCKVICLFTEHGGMRPFIIECSPEGGHRETEIDIPEHKRLLSTCCTKPLMVRERTAATLCLPPDPSGEWSGHVALLDSILTQTSIALERELLAREKEAARAEMEQERFRSNLLRAISHDLRTPLAGIVGLAEVLMKNTEGELSETAEGIYEDAVWLTQLVENILNLTRIQEKRVTLHLRPEPVEEVVTSAVRHVAKYVPERHIQVKLPEEVLFALMDSSLIEQVLINLVDNACKHTPKGTEITVSVWNEGDRVWFEVSDRGEGIAPEYVSKIFDPFYMSAVVGPDAKRGIGLGLPICKAIVEYHGSQITVCSSPSGGASFRFYLNPLR